MHIDKFNSLKTVKRAVEKYGYIKFENQHLIIKFINDNKENSKILDIYFHIAVLGILSNESEIEKAMHNKLNATGFIGASLDTYINLYGATCGNILFKRRGKEISLRNKITSSKEYIKTLYSSDEEYLEYKRLIGRKISSTKLKNNKNRDVREDSPLCIEYYISRNIIDMKYINDKILEQKSKSWVYCADEATKKLILKKCKTTKIKNIENGSMPKNGGYSIQANKFFSKLIRLLPNEIVKNVITIETTGREYWIRDTNDKTKYYFIDFCIPNIFAIEYNGNAYHPKAEIDDNYRAYLLGGLSTKDKYEYDRRKCLSIENTGMALLEIWDNEIDINFTLDWIKEKYYERA